MKRLRISLIVPTYKRERPLVETLESLLAIEYPRDSFEIILIDQTPVHEAPTQRFLERKEAAGQIRWFRPPEVTFASLTKARNFGMRKAERPDLFVFVDDDVEVQTDFLAAHSAVYADEKVGATVGKVTVPGHSYPSHPSLVGSITWWGRFIDNYHSDKAVESDGFIGCNFSLKADLLSEIGEFDEEFVGNAVREDSDMALRVREIGKKILFLPEAAIIHKLAPSGGTRAEARIAWYRSLFHNNFLFYAKHAPAWRLPFFVMQMWRPILACWLYYGKGSPAAFIAPWSGIISGIRAAGRSKKAGRAIPGKSRLNQIF